MWNVLYIVNIYVAKGRKIRETTTKSEKKNSYMDKTLFILLEQRFAVFFIFPLDAFSVKRAKEFCICVAKVRFRNHHHVWRMITLSRSDDGDRIFMSVYACVLCCLRIKISAPNFTFYFFFCYNFFFARSTGFFLP